MDDIVAIRNFCGLSTAKFLKLKKSIEILRPALKNVVFLANLKKRFAEFEKEGNLPIEVKNGIPVNRYQTIWGCSKRHPPHHLRPGWHCLL